LSTDAQRMPDWLKIMTTPGTLVEPTGIAVSGEHIVVADHRTNTVICLDDNGCKAKQLSFTDEVGSLKLPHGLLALETRIMVADTLNHRIVELDLDLRTIRATEELAGKPLRRPHGFASNSPDEYFLADTDNDRILRVAYGKGEHQSSAEELPLVSLKKPLKKPCGLGISPQQLFIADTWNHRLLITEQSPQTLRVYGKEGRNVGAFKYPVAVASWQEWFVVSDEMNKRLQLWRADEEGGYLTASCISSNLCSPWLGSPFGVIFDTNGRLFVADRQKGQVLRVEFNRMLKAFAYDSD
jgi:DNA-binding beta-propeller fold protein YncE